MSSYETNLNISEFKGLMQYGDGINVDMRYATHTQNMETIGGVLQPAAACELLTPTLTSPIETIARLHRRWHAGDDKDVLIAGSGGKLYYMLPGDSDWSLLNMPSGVTNYTSNVWSWVTYEINPEGSTASVDVLLLSNAYDGMVMVRGDNMSVTKVPTPKKFGTIERYAERIWGGAIIDDPDMLVYSAPYDPMNWEANTEIPEDGAGDLNQPSWDGDSFTALRTFGSQLIAFKKTRIWRILGTDPGEYTFKEQYGGGAAYPGTVSVDNERILMLAEKGVQIYDGLSASPYLQEYCAEIWKRMNRAKLDEARAILWHGKYYVAIPMNGSAINNAVVIYDTHDGTWLLRDDVFVENWLGTENELYFTSATTPGRVWKWHENSWEIGEATSAAVSWETPWTDMGAKNVNKGGYDLYFLCEAQDDVTLRFTIYTEKKTKVKTWLVKSGNQRQKRLHFGGNGRRFKLKIEASTGVWRIVSGVFLIVETDPD